MKKSEKCFKITCSQIQVDKAYGRVKQSLKKWGHRNSLGSKCMYEKSWNQSYL